MILKKQTFKLIIAAFNLILLLFFSCSSEKKMIKDSTKSANTPSVILSINLMHAVKVKDKSKIKAIQSELSILNEDNLASQLITDSQKKAFWINIYNAHIQIVLTEDPLLFEDRGSFFNTPRVTIANKILSFDNMEHGIIRSSKFKLALGLIKNPFANNYEKKFRTKNTDDRVHFALNCGAKSCPLVAIYNASDFDQKIDKVAQHFLQKMSTYNVDDSKIVTTPLFSWFRGDFGGKSGMLKYLKKYKIVPEDKKPTIIFDNYDWTLSLENYYERS